MKFSKIDIVFVIVYLIILIILLMVTPVTEVGGYDSVEESTTLWDNIFWIILYAIAVPIIYFLIRWGSQKKK